MSDDDLILRLLEETGVDSASINGQPVSSAEVQQWVRENRGTDQDGDR